MKKFLLSIGVLMSGAVIAQDCSDLFISEYVEGWGNNKAIELYNPTPDPIYLVDYLLVRYSNGAGFVGAESAVVLSGIIEPYTTYVAVLDKRNPSGEDQEAPVWDELQAKADGFYCPDYNISKAMYFNGNDAVTLEKGTLNDVDNGSTTLIDLFGKIGEDPDVGEGYFGWTTEHPFVGVGVDITKDMSLIRKPGVMSGVTANPGFFNALVEWDTIPAVLVRFDEFGDTIFNQAGNPVVDGNWETLGSHDCECDPNLSITQEEALKNLSIYPNPSTNGEFYFSGERTVVSVQVYSTTGQEILNKENTSGLQSINIGATPGVYLINIKTAEGIVSSRRIIVK